MTGQTQNKHSKGMWLIPGLYGTLPRKYAVKLPGRN
jgi:hypothetical protein